MQQKEASLFNSLETLIKVEQKIGCVQGVIGKRVFDKLNAVLGRNPDLDLLRIYHQIIQGDELSEEQSAKVQLSPGKIAALKYSPVTTVDTERSFSIHKALLSDKRRRMTVENLEMYLVCAMEL